MAASHGPIPDHRSIAILCQVPYPLSVLTQADFSKRQYRKTLIQYTFTSSVVYEFFKLSTNCGCLSNSSNMCKITKSYYCQGCGASGVEMEYVATWHVEGGNAENCNAFAPYNQVNLTNEWPYEWYIVPHCATCAPHLHHPGMPRHETLDPTQGLPVTNPEFYDQVNRTNVTP